MKVQDCAARFMKLRNDAIVTNGILDVYKKYA
jgi:hypothetical protein